MYDLPELNYQRHGALLRAVNFDKRRPQELKAHAAFVKDDGGWQIFEVWETIEAWETFFKERYLEAMRGRSRHFTLDILSTNDTSSTLATSWLAEIREREL